MRTYLCLHLCEYPCADEFVEVFSGGGLGDLGVAGQLCSGPCASIQQGQAKGCAGLIGKERGEGSKSFSNRKNIGSHGSIIGP